MFLIWASRVSYLSIWVVNFSSHQFLYCTSFFFCSIQKFSRIPSPIEFTSRPLPNWTTVSFAFLGFTLNLLNRGWSSYVSLDSNSMVFNTLTFLCFRGSTTFLFSLDGSSTFYIGWGAYLEAPLMVFLCLITTPYVISLSSFSIATLFLCFFLAFEVDFLSLDLCRSTFASGRYS